MYYDIIKQYYILSFSLSNRIDFDKHTHGTH